MLRFLTAAAAALIPHALCAQEATVYLGTTITSDYVSSGESLSDGDPALQPYVEVELSSGFYGGLWLSNISPGPDDIEFDLYAGYRGAAGKFSYDLSYVRYLYDSSGDCCGEAIVGVDYAVTDALSLGTELVADLEGGGSATLRFETYLPYDLTISGEYTWNNEEYGDGEDWNLGLGKSLTDTVSVDARYHEATGGDAIYTVSLSWDTDYATLFGR